MDLCKFKDMDQCAKEFCPFWDYEEGMCAHAVELRMKIKVLKRIDYILEMSEVATREAIAIRILNTISDAGQTIQ